MKIISGIFGLIILFYACFLPIYLLFYNSAEDSVEELSLATNAENLIKMEMKYGRAISSNEAKDLLEQLEKEKEKYLKKGVDLTKPLYEILEENKKVTDLDIVDLNKEEFGTLGSLVNSYAGGELFAIRCKIQGQKFELPVIVIPPSFFKVRRAIAWTPQENLLKIFYIK